jgi:DNA processing protein
MNDDLISRAALAGVGDLGPALAHRLIEMMGSPRAVLSASAPALMAFEGMTPRRAEKIGAMGKGIDAFARSLDRVLSEGVSVLADTDPGYPEPLRMLGDDAPLVLYVRGALAPDDDVSVAIVGSRKCSPYGKSTAARLAGELARAGLTVISGGARGIDTHAHVGSLGAGGRTIAVMGSGIDVPYPGENQGLFARIAQAGAVISEFPPGTQPDPGNFPRRNRLVSGMALGVVVVEAAARSGARITARLALEQGKEVFAVPGNIGSPTSEGTNELIRDGATIALSAEDIVREIAPQLKARLASVREAGPASPALSAEERALYDIISAEPRHVDEIARASGLPVTRVLALLLGLELQGVVQQTEGKIFFRA